MDNAKLYASLYKAYVAAYPKKSKLVCQQEFNVRWTELKKEEGYSLEDKEADTSYLLVHFICLVYVPVQIATYKRMAAARTTERDSDRITR